MIKQLYIHGYIIVDIIDGYAQHHSLRSNRKTAWQAAGAQTKEEKALLREIGYRCLYLETQIPVNVKG